MAQIETWYNQDLKQPVKVHYLHGNVFSQDNQANIIGVNVFIDGTPATLVGDVSASIIRSDGATVSAVGTLSGNQASVAIPAAAYAVPGMLSIVLKLAGGGSTTTLCAVVANVYQSATDEIVDPGTVLPSIQTLIDEIESAVATIPADYSSLNGYFRNVIIMESGTFSDSDGTTRTSNTARKRNKSPLYIGNVAGIVIPSGYEAYIYCLNSQLQKVGVVNWTNTYFNVFNAIAGTEYINFAVRSISSPTSDISSANIEPVIVRQGAYSVIPLWNVKRGGIAIAGDSIIVNADGFGFIKDDNRYYIAPTDQTTVTTFTPQSLNNPYVLVADVTKLSAGVRNNPSTALSIVPIADKDINSERYIAVAMWYDRKWNFVGSFDYYNSIAQRPFITDYVTWNSKQGGIKIVGNDVIVNQDGFAIAYNGNLHYIAPVDLETITTFTAPSPGSTYLLVIDPVLLVNPGSRINPASVMSVIDYYGVLYNKQYIVVANYYKGYWKFAGEFSYFSQVDKAGTYNNIFNECHIIAHKGGNSGTENTIANFISAFESGYKAVECDIQFTSDGVIVLFHDDSFTVGGVTYVIASNTYDDLITVKPDLAKFEDLIVVCKRANMVIDVDFTKTYTPAQTAALYNLIKQYGAQCRCMVTCFPSTARQLLSYESIPICVSQITSESAVDDVLDIIQKSAVCFCSISYDNVTDALIEYMHNKGAFVKVWTVNQQSNAVAYIESGADMIISDSLTDSVITTFGS